MGPDFVSGLMKIFWEWIVALCLMPGNYALKNGSNGNF